MTPKIALFASGSGSNVENIIRYFSGNKNFEFPLILSNKPDAFVHERAKMLGVPSFTFSRDDFAEGHKIVSFLKEYDINFIILAGFLLKISAPILETFPNKIMSEVAAKVKAIIVEKLGVDESEVVPTASFTNDLGADSLDTVELIMEFEKEFGVTIPEDQAEKISTVGDAIAYIEAL